MKKTFANHKMGWSPTYLIVQLFYSMVNKKNTDIYLFTIYSHYLHPSSLRAPEAPDEILYIIQLIVIALGIICG